MMQPESPATGPRDKVLFKKGADTKEKPAVANNNKKAWKVLVADDEPDVHNITRMVLSDYEFEGRALDFLSAYSGKEARSIMVQNPDCAIILLDVVMETDDSGLEVARFIRQQLRNEFVRIVLRTGQPGKAPEREIITRYDINDYKEKTELTAQKLYTVVTSSLRAYRDLRIIEKNRKGLEKIIESSACLFEVQSLKHFAQGVLTQLLSILHLDESSLYVETFGFTATQHNSTYRILAATGKYEDSVDKDMMSVLPEDIIGQLRQAIAEERSIYVEDAYVGYFPTSSGAKNLLYVRGCRHLTDLDKDLIRIFSHNVGIAFENIYLNQELVDTQKEMIMTLGEVLESRSREAGNHVRRVAEFSYLLALKAGLPESQAELLRLASPMHDLGKVGVPDSILLKPGNLSREEYEVVKAHTNIGHQILKKSNRDISRAASIVAQQHHERWDGKGYPQGLAGEQIHIFGRITGIADVFDALCHRRIYKEPWRMDKVVERIREERGKYFDPRLTDIFLANLDDFLRINDAYPDADSRPSDWPELIA
ncbi:MAG: DUF3369 domain-containing protein [Thermodesulfobacteriota bacterium]